MLLPCTGVHMYGMKFPLDLIFLDNRGHVVKTIGTLEPWQRSGWIPAARSALEVPTGTIAATRTRVGDRLVWRSAEPLFYPSDGLEQPWYGKAGNGDGDGARQPAPDRRSEDGGQH